MFFLIPQAPGARSARLATRHSARGAVAPSGLLRSPAPVMADALPVAGREVNHFPRRRARAPLACLRAMRRGTRSRAPHHGAVEGAGSARQHRLMQNETRQTTTAAAFGRSSIARLPLHPARGRRCGHRRRRHHRRDHGPHPGGGRRVLALRRRPLRQERARPDPPTAGGRPRQRGVGACARRAYRGPGGAHPDRDPADADALRPGRSQRARGARVDGRARPPGAGSQAHRRHRQAPSRAGARGGEPTSSGSQAAALPARARRRSGRASRPRPWPPSARSSRGGPGGLRAPSHRRRSTRGILRNPTIPVNPT